MPDKNVWNLRAHRRVRRSPRLRQYFAIIFRNWPETEDAEHLKWITTASFQEIIAWTKMVEKSDSNTKGK